MNLKQHIHLNEIKSQHAAVLYDYHENFHDEMYLMIHDQLLKSWTSTIKAVSKSYKLNTELEIEKFEVVTNTNQKIQNGRFSSAKHTNLFVRIPLVYNQQLRNVIKKQLFADAEQTFNTIIKKYSDIFNVGTKTLFKTSMYENDVKFQFGDGPNSLQKTLFLVSVEHGTGQTKTRNTDKIYFIDTGLK